MRPPGDMRGMQEERTEVAALMSNRDVVVGLNYMLLARREFMSAQTSAARHFFCQLATKIISVV